jgi:hypothetical protein
MTDEGADKAKTSTDRSARQKIAEMILVGSGSCKEHSSSSEIRREKHKDLAACKDACMAEPECSFITYEEEEEECSLIQGILCKFEDEDSSAVTYAKPGWFFEERPDEVSSTEAVATGEEDSSTEALTTGEGAEEEEASEANPCAGKSEASCESAGPWCLFFDGACLAPFKNLKDLWYITSEGKCKNHCACKVGDEINTGGTCESEGRCAVYKFDEATNECGLYSGAKSVAPFFSIKINWGSRTPNQCRYQCNCDKGVDGCRVSYGTEYDGPDECKSYTFDAKKEMCALYTV